ncbi:MAG: hypothetical protein QNJ12_06675 [Ilumatobacter sp.]|uniref:hypothetical protein n=1 Tax=Ilumatobacter sp. TaxID=1967498 RepID=UPI002609927C|nr:hypothetical protein [Ilumatobacter sp.]MDJ0768459.1 hypothetical protein [Ilumatobacter sp.]
MTGAARSPSTAGRDAAQPGTVLKGLQLHPSEDFALLRKQGIEHIQRLGHRLWTDYNVHDPGITLLELACYAITDLGYRAGYDMADLLTDDERSGDESNFHTALSILTCDPVTFYDLRKRLVDIPGVRNAWVEANRTVTHRPGATRALNGLYDVLVELDDRVADRQPFTVGPVDRSRGSYVGTGDRAMRLRVRRPVRLVAASVYARERGTVVVRLTHGAETLDEVEHEVTVVKDKTRLELGFEVPAGSGYRLDCVGSSVELWHDFKGAPQRPTNRLPVAFGDGERDGQRDDAHYFFYDVEVDAAVANDGTGVRGLTALGVRNTVFERIHEDRNLGEEVVSVREASREEIAFCADIEVKPNADVEQVVVGIFTRLRRHVAPPVDFHTIDELLDAGRSADEVFDGPTLDHGFIDDEAFRETTQLCEVRVSDVIRLVMADDDVLSVKQAKLLSFVDGKLRTEAEWLLTLATDEFRSPVIAPARSKLVIYKDGLPYYPSRARLERLLEDAEPTLRGKLSDDERDLDVPVGRDRSVATFSPIQDELPANYFAGRRDVPDTLGPVREAQSKQLKGYLMFFEQLLANFLSQLSHVRDLFSWEVQDEPRTYYTQPVGEPEGWAHDLFGASARADLTATLETIIESRADAIERRDRFLDHLLGRFAEDFTEYSLLMYSRLLADDDTRVIDDKCRFLRNAPAISGGRGGAYDCRRPALDGSDNLSGLQRRVYALMGFRDATRRRFADARFTIEQDPGDDRWRFVVTDDDGIEIFRSDSGGCESHTTAEALLDLALTLGGDEQNYVKRSAGGHELHIWQGDRDCGVIGHTRNKQHTGRVIELFAERADAEGFHVVEHLLLRPRRPGDPLLAEQPFDPEEPNRIVVDDPYSFRVSVVLPSWPRRFQNVSFRRLIERTLRAGAPAHVLLRICWVTHDQMRSFEDAYEDWSKAHAALVAASAGLAGGPKATSAHRRTLARLIERLEGLVNVHPIARLHDPDALTGDAPAVTLNNTNLGTF